MSDRKIVFSALMIGGYFHLHRTCSVEVQFISWCCPLWFACNVVFCLGHIKILAGSHKDVATKCVMCNRWDYHPYRMKHNRAPDNRLYHPLALIIVMLKDMCCDSAYTKYNIRSENNDFSSDDWRAPSSSSNIHSWRTIHFMVLSIMLWLQFCIFFQSIVGSLKDPTRTSPRNAFWILNETIYLMD